MKRSLISVALLALLALTPMARADETTIPPEVNWTPYPPAQATINVAPPTELLAQLIELLAKKSVITCQEEFQLMSTIVVMPAAASCQTVR